MPFIHMKKTLIILLTFILIACAPEEKDYYNFYIDDYSITVGYDNDEYLKNVFDFEDIVLNENETKENIDLQLLGKHFGNINLINYKKKNIVTYFEFNIKDYGSSYKIDDSTLDKSIKTNCDLLGGEYINKNNVNACIIQKQVGNKTNALIMYGDLLNDDLDELSKIEIHIK